jgi:hypothetical protein
MNGMAQNNHTAMRISCLTKWLWLCLLIGLAAKSGLATSSDYQNDAVVNYTVPPDPLPTIDATNFINNNSFTINFTTFGLNTELYEPRNVVNYTNYDLMNINTGFRFDTQTAANTHLMAGSFYNAGTVSCASFGNQTGIFFFNTLGVFTSIFAGQFIVSATNIVNPGTVIVGADGLMKLTGKHVDLSRTTMTMESFDTFNFLNGNPFGNLGVTGITSAIGTDTNGWVPSIELTPTSAFASAPLFFFLTNSTPYFDVANPTPTNVIIRAVFLQNPSPNVTANVYFGVNNIGPGAATIEWAGNYTDSSTGTANTNYLYLNNDYLLGASTNVFVFNGIPDNYTFFSSPTQVPLGAATASGFPPNIIQPFGAIVTNTYNYVDAQLLATTVSTNASVSNPSGDLRNITGRLEITADDDLDLNLALISGANFLSLTATNQFNGSDGALITAPYANIAIGVTNGFLTVSNLLESTIPNWSGDVQAWSATWKYTDTNGVVYDYRVLLVNSQINPTTSAYVQDLALHGSNSVVIADTFNILRSLYIDSQNLTLTTNGPGNGATSLDGELNLLSSGIFISPATWPNMRNVTNNGAIRTMNLVQFSAVTNSVAATPSTPAVKASGTLAEVAGRANVPAGSKVLIGTNQYVFVKTLANKVPNQVKIAGNFNASMSNLIAAINRAAGAGKTYSSNTLANFVATAGPLNTNHSFVVTARTAGTTGNLIVTTTTTSNLTWNGHSNLFGGINATTGFTNVTTVPVAYDNLINNGLISDQGAAINANYLLSCGTFTNGAGNFMVQSKNTILTNGGVYASGDISITTGSLLVSNLPMSAGRGLTLAATDLLTDGGVTSSNIWFVGAASGAGFRVPIKPLICSLLGTTITNVSTTNKDVANTWSGKDMGAVNEGYDNNEALGRLILDGAGDYPHNGHFHFYGTGTSNALYVDYLELRNSATNRNSSGDLTSLVFNTNLVIYYAQAVQNGQSVAEKLNHKNGDHLRWMPTYAGNFSSTNLVYPPGVTNTLNIALVQSPTTDSDGDGIFNNVDPTPLFVPDQINLSISMTNLPPLSVRVQWTTVPNATNFIYYRTNMVSGPWLPLTNFNQYYYGNNVAVTNAAHSNNFISPQSYPAPATNVWVFDAISAIPRYYHVEVQPWLTFPF